MATKNEKKSFDKIANLGCILCAEILGFEGSQAELHHVRRYGNVRSASPVLALCPEHHRNGNDSIHRMGVKGFEKNGEYPVRSCWNDRIRNLERELSNDDIHYGRPIEG